MWDLGQPPITSKQAETRYGETQVAVHVPLAEPTDVELFMAVP